MVIIEFCGTPGSGKTTICDEVERLLSEKGYRVRNLQKRMYPANYLDKLMVRIKRYLFCSYSKNKRLKQALEYLTPYLPKDSLINWPERILESFYRMEKARRAGIQVGLFDEGCIQFITSVFHDKAVVSDIEPFVAVLKEEMYRYDTLLVDCLIDEEENYQRLAERDKPDDRFLKAGEAGCKQLLERKRKNIEIVLNMIKLQRIMTMETSEIETEEAAEAVVNNLHEQFIL